MLAVVALVALRLALGCHFLYEGLWKIEHSDKFSAEPFLSHAKGPIAPLFYAMCRTSTPERLKMKAGNGKRRRYQPFTTRWDNIRQDLSTP
jgi:hypothetical protein